MDVKARFCVCIPILSASLFVYVVLAGHYTSYWNDDCLLSAQNLKNLRKAVFAVAEIYQQYNQTYWLDFGTLLGAYRSGDILPHDGDADISRLIPQEYSSQKEYQFMETVSREIQAKIGGIVHKQRYLFYKGVYVDLCRWELDGSGNIYRHIAGQPQYTQIRRHIPTEDYQLSWYVPVVDIEFAGKRIAAPRNTTAVLIRHYGNNFRTPVPFKWKCYFTFS